MAKKYLLYIHDDRFEAEENKSALVNELLGLHYGASKQSVDIEPLAGKKVIEVVADLVQKPCKHGADPKFCRFAKPGKPCKIK